MEKRISRRSFIKRTLSTIFTVFAVGSGSYFYAHSIEPKLLNISKYTIRHEKIPASFNEFKIIQFSDTHLGFQYTLAQLEKLILKINQHEPDIIFFTGDLIDDPKNYPEAGKLTSILKNLKAPFGKFAVYGNHDHGGYGTNLYEQIMTNAGFHLLLNEAAPVELLDKSQIYIVGIDDAMLGKPDIKTSLKNVPADGYKILLSHAPDLADDAQTFNIHLQLSGHSHGGQIQIPFLGALVKPPFAEKYVEGMYKITGDEPLTLYVNRGLGTTRLPFRFLSRPELSIFTLSSS